MWGSKICKKKVNGFIRKREEQIGGKKSREATGQKKRGSFESRRERWEKFKKKNEARKR